MVRLRRRRNRRAPNSSAGSGKGPQIIPPSQGGAGGVGSNVILVFNGSGALTDRLLVVPPSGGSSYSMVLADENSSNVVSWALPDDEGSIRDVAQYGSGTDTTTVVDHLVYDSFGNITSQTNSAYQPLYAYAGMLADAGSGFYYDHARWYDPQLGKFITQDPTSFAGGDSNLSRYVNNGPANATDPTGLAELNVNPDGAKNAPWMKAKLPQPRTKGKFVLGKTYVSRNS